MTTKQYLKMADAFNGDIDQDDIVILDCGLDTLTHAPEEYAAHAINSHDELVDENERLVSVLWEVDRVLSEMQKNGVLVYWLDDLIDDVSTSIQSRSES